MTTSQPPTLYTTKQLADAAGLSYKRIRQLAEEERAADDAGKACEHLRQMGCDTGFSTEYAAEWDRLDRIYTDARNQASATELAIFEQSPAARADYQRFRALVVRHYNAS